MRQTCKPISLILWEWHLFCWEAAQEFKGKHGGGSRQPAVKVDYTCISNPESDKKIYVILKNYHGAYWEKNRWYNRSCKKLDEAVYLGGIDKETDISGQIDLMNQAMEQGAAGASRIQFTGRQLSEGTGKGYSGSTY